MKIAGVYDTSFYARMTSSNGTPNSDTSAREIVPYLIRLFPNTSSVIDVGCGIGTWLRQFEINGVNDVLGLDGNWVQQEQLLINPQKFMAVDLEKEYSLHRKFDMAISLEVAEHITPVFAETFIKQLVSLSDIIISFTCADFMDTQFDFPLRDYVMTMDVIEHIPTSLEDKFMGVITKNLQPHGVAIIGTPNITMYQYASKWNKYSHINNYDQSRLYDLCRKYFHQVFIFSMTDEVLHVGFDPMSCYIFALCCEKI